MKILIIFLSGLGNAILFEPTLRALGKKSTVDMCIKEKIVEALYKSSGLVDNFIYYPKLPFKKYDVVISSSGRLYWKEKLFLFLLRAKRKITYEQVGYSEDIHEVDCHLRLARALGVKIIDRIPQIYIPKNTRQFIQKKNILIIGMHPGCSEALKYKRWPLERFAKVVDIIAKGYKARIVIFGGLEEIELSQKVAKIMKTTPLILTGKTNIFETALAIGCCDLFITNDSGLMHLASVMRVPIVAIFGPTNAVKNAPLSKHIILQKDNGSLEAIKVQDVIQAIKQLCQICQKK